MARGDSSAARSVQRSAPTRAGATGASLAGLAAVAFLAVLIYVGSQGLATFDSALIGYAVAIVALTYAVVDRYARWLTMPSTSAVCTHLQCEVLPRLAEDDLYCPCHEGHFDPRTGAPTAGPPERALPQIRLEFDGDAIVAVGEGPLAPGEDHGGET